MGGNRVLVVGAGPGGLSAAMVLAHRGFDVTVVEKEREIGGRSARLTLGEYTFDTGPTFLMMKFILDELFREVGRELESYVSTVRLDPMYRLQFDDREIEMTDDRDRMEQRIGQVFGEEAVGYRKFLRKERLRFERLLPSLRRPYTRLGDLLSRELVRAAPYFSPTKSLFGVLGNYFREDKLKLCFTFQAKYLGMSPWECPGGFAIIPYIEHAFGIYHVEGGLNRICSAMAEVLAEEGGEIRTEAPVKSLLLDGRRVTGCRLENGEKLEADYVVMNADFAYGMSQLVPTGALRKYSPERLKRRSYSCSTYMLYLGLDKLYDLPHHSIYFAGDYRRNVEDIFSFRDVSEDFSVYVQNPSITDGTLAPEGHSALYVLVPVANRNSQVEWGQRRMEMRDRVIDALKQRTNMTDIEEHIKAEMVITPKEWERDYNVFLGATFNLAHTIRQMLYFRPRNRFEELDGLYLVGGGTHPGSGLPTIYQSAVISSDLISEDAGISVASGVGGKAALGR